MKPTSRALTLIPTDPYTSFTSQARPSLLRLARRLCQGDLDLADDIVQDAIVHGFETYASGRLSIGPGLRAWLAKSVTSRYLMSKRKDKRLLKNQDELIASVPAPPQETISESNSLSAKLEEALDDLPEEQRLVVILVDIQELSYQECADSLRVPVGTVRSRLSRARWALALRLAGHLGQTHDRER